MPLYDRICDCGWSKEDCYEPRDFTLACPTCGELTKRQWTRMSIIPDTFSTPLVDDNITKTTQVFYSRSERKAAMKKYGMRERFQHVEFNHSDKSPYSVKWR